MKKEDEPTIEQEA